MYNIFSSFYFLGVKVFNLSQFQIELMGILLLLIVLMLEIFNKMKILTLIPELMRSHKEGELEVKLNLLFKKSDETCFETKLILTTYIFKDRRDKSGEAETLLLEIEKSNREIFDLRLSYRIEDFDSIYSKIQGYIKNLEEIKSKYST